MTTFYISGPMTGIPEHNYPAFHAVHAALVNRMLLTDKDKEFMIHNPAYNFGGMTNLQREEYLREDMRLITQSNVIVLLPGWENSAGAKLEVEVGKAIGCKFILAIALMNKGQPDKWRFDEVPLPPLTVSSEPVSPREDVLVEAIGLVTGDRNNHYGPPTQDFQRTADILNAMGYRASGDRLLAPHDTALLVMAVKMSRLVWSPEKRDHWADMAGYSGCGWECITEEVSK